jgi:Ni/Co efflux regulator RcnB
MTALERWRQEMKKFALALAGASVALTGLAAAPAAAADFRDHNRGHYQQVNKRVVVKNRVVTRNRFVNQNRFMNQNRFVNHNRFMNQNRFQAHRWNRGDRFDSRYATNYMVVSNPYAYNLRAAPYGYRWVRSGDDAVLIAITSGIIGAILANGF